MSTDGYWDESGMDYAVDVMDGGLVMTFHAVKPPTPPRPQVSPTHPVRAAARRRHRPAVQARLTPSREHLLQEIWRELQAVPPGRRRATARLVRTLTCSLSRTGRLHVSWTFVDWFIGSRGVFWPDLRDPSTRPPPYRLSPTRGTP